MKRKVIFTSLVLLCMMLIVGIGFAVWDIKNDPANDQASGNIIAYGVVQNGTLDVQIVNSSGVVPTYDSEHPENEYGYYNKVVFGKPNPLVSGVANDPPWLISNDIGDEHLDIYIKVSVTYEGLFKIEDSILDPADPNNPIDTGLFGGPSFSIVNALTTGCTASLVPKTESAPYKLDITNVSGTGSVVLKVTYKWPDLSDTWKDVFKVTKNGNDYYNPYYYFNSHGKNDLISTEFNTSTLIDQLNTMIGLSGGNALTSSSTYADFAIAYLTKLHEVSQDIAFKITFTEVNQS